VTRGKEGHALVARRAFVQAGLTAAASVFGGGIAVGARAQALIESLRILCIAGPGSGPDLCARRLAEQLSGRFARSVVVDNRPGAAGRIAVTALKLAPTDGSILLLAGPGVTVLNPLVYSSLGYDPAIDLQPVSSVAEMPLALAVGPAVPDSIGSARDLIGWMRANPGLANVGSPGVGSGPHLLEARLFHEAHVAWVHVAYPSGPPSVMALIGGQIAALVLPEAVLRPHRVSGKLRVLATSGAQRSAYLPDVPTLVEQGFRALVAQEWFGLFMHGRVPAAIAEATSEAIRSAMARPEFVAALADLGMVAGSSTPAALAARIAAEQRVWAPVVRDMGIRAD
jgi:tripartite-type tricarboxylate transporter receptor subunit TctC